MKKVLLVLSLVTMFSCDKEEVAPGNETVVENCDCDRIVDIKKFYIVGDAQSGKPGFYYCPITTINDCNKMQKYRDFHFNNESSIPKVGNCHDMGY